VELYQHAALLVLGSDVADGLDWRTEYGGDVIDLRRDLVRRASRGRVANH
jgi:hypothetical protein